MTAATIAITKVMRTSWKNTQKNFKRYCVYLVFRASASENSNGFFSSQSFDGGVTGNSIPPGPNDYWGLYTSTCFGELRRLCHLLGQNSA